MKLALALLTLGEISLILDLGNRLLGSGLRTPARVLIKISQIVFACVLLAVPAFLVSIEPELGPVRYLFYVSSFVGTIIFVHFLFPYRFGISKVRQKRPAQREREVISNVVLRNESVSVPSLVTDTNSLQFLVISDLHCNSQEKLNLIKNIFDKLSNETFDIVLILGDLSEKSKLLPELFDVLATLPNCHGIFLVRGNHDFYKDRQVLIEDLAKRRSIKILSNTISQIPGLGIELVGLEYPPDCTQLPAKSECSMTLGLTHTPDNIIAYSKMGVDIVVAGHTHGGWFRVPLLGRLLIPSRLGRFLNEGWFRRGNTLMYITTGLPYFEDPKGKRGEILKLTIKSNKEKEGLAKVEDSM
jgi:predicted MPP superfamily phosphohydrolase